MVVIIAVAGAAVALIFGVQYGETAASLIGLLLAFVAPLVILERILRSPTITVRLVLGRSVDLPPPGSRVLVPLSA